MSILFRIAVPADDAPAPVAVITARQLAALRRYLRAEGDRIITNAAADNAAYFAAVACAERRATHSYFDQHVIQDDELGYFAIDEGDYGALGQPMIDRIVYTAPGGMLDEF